MRPKSILFTLLCLGISCAGYARLLPLGEWLDAAKANPEVSELRQEFIDEVSATLYDPERALRRRSYDMGGLAAPGHNAHIAAFDYSGQQRDLLALALDDIYQAQQLTQEMPALAAAYRLSERADYLNRLTAQLQEVVTWDPWQRSGAILINQNSWRPLADQPKVESLGAGTKLMVRAIADTLEILPEGALDEDLKFLIHARFEMLRDPLREALLTEGHKDYAETLFRICTALGLDREDEDLALARKHYLRYALRKNPLGEWPEGTLYANSAMPGDAGVARTLGLQGDLRLLRHKHLKESATWYMHHFMPGYQWLNTGENPGMHPTNRKAFVPRDFLAQIYALTSEPAAAWAMEEMFDGIPPTLWGLLAKHQRTTAKQPAPPLKAAVYYPKSMRLFWRNGWDQHGTALVITGAARDKNTAQAERGHITWYANGDPVLIEGGNPPNTDPLGMFIPAKGSFCEASAHNILQAGSAPVTPDLALIRVGHIDESGGSLTMNINKGYENVNAWSRKLSWNERVLRFEDTVTVSSGERVPLHLHWHLGSKDEVEITRLGPRIWRVDWNRASIHIQSNTPIEITQERYPGFTLIRDPETTRPVNHAKLRVSTQHSVLRWQIETTVTAK